MARVKKIVFASKELLEALQPFLRELLPGDALAITAYNAGPDTFGVLVQSADYQDIEAGDLVFYAPELEAAKVEVPESKKK